MKQSVISSTWLNPNCSFIKWSSLLVIFIFIPCLFIHAASYEESQERIAQGIELFSRGLYEEALVLFRGMVVDPEFRSHHGDAYFWIAKCQMVLGQLDNAEKNLEYFLIHFDNHLYYSEGVYQKGRLLFMQNEFEKSIEILEQFINHYPTSVFISNAYFWVAESVFFLGYLEKALQIYKYIVIKFPNSYKFETAKYRISIIEFKKRENELLKLLKWSHLEALKTMEEYQQREKTYEQAIVLYQKKLSDAGINISEYDTENAEVQKLAAELEKKNKEIEDLNRTIEVLKQQIKYLEIVTGTPVPDEDIVTTIDLDKEKKKTELSNDERLLELQKEAEQLKTLLEKLLRSAGGGK
ncbi:MAG: tetratricopeptide repeat protein [Spirochaetales bacterium]|nr:tetratricopeptide repeat protein [Spirochaetales bacterium]